MSRFSLIPAILGVILITPPTAPAESPTAGGGATKNAALAYWRAFALLPKLDDDQKDAIRDSLDRLGPVDKELIPVIESSAPSLKELHRAAKMPTCDWGLAVEDGVDAMMPHLSVARELSRLACLRAQWRFEQGQTSGAVEDATAVMALGRHAGSDGLLISILVDYAIQRQAIRLIAAYLPGLDANARSDLSRRLNGLPAGKTMRQAILREKEVFLEGFIRELTKEDGKERLLKSFGGSDDPAVAMIRGLSRAELLKAAKGMRRVYDNLATIVSLPPDKVKPAEEKLLADPDLDPLVVRAAKLLTPALTAARSAEAAHQARLAMLKAAVAVTANGPQALSQKELRDPFGDGPFQYSAFDGGFELTSKLKGRDNKPVSLTIGRRPAE